MVAYAERFDLNKLQLNVSSPAIGEEYHADWQRKAHPPLTRQWRTEIPLIVHGVTVGRLIVVGVVDDGPVVSTMSELIEGLRPFEMQLTGLLEDLMPSSQDSDSRIDMSLAGVASSID